MHGATGRMGTTQHLRNLLDIEREGDLAASPTDPANDIVFDCAITGYRTPNARKAIAARSVSIGGGQSSASGRNCLQE